MLPRRRRGLRPGGGLQEIRTAASPKTMTACAVPTHVHATRFVLRTAAAVNRRPLVKTTRRVARRRRLGLHERRLHRRRLLQRGGVGYLSDRRRVLRAQPAGAEQSVSLLLFARYKRANESMRPSLATDLL